MNKKCMVLLTEGFEEIEAVTPIDLLRRAGIMVTTVGIQGLSIKGAHSIQIEADIRMNEITDQYDAVVLPGGPGVIDLSESSRVISFLSESFKQGRLCCAICAAPLIFDKAGILRDKKFTCFPGIEKRIGSGKHQTTDVVCDGTVITSRGAGTAIPFSLAIIERLNSAHDAHKIAETILFRQT